MAIVYYVLFPLRVTTFGYNDRFAPSWPTPNHFFKKCKTSKNKYIYLSLRCINLKVSLVTFRSVTIKGTVTLGSRCQYTYRRCLTPVKESELGPCKTRQYCWGNIVAKTWFPWMFPFCARGNVSVEEISFCFRKPKKKNVSELYNLFPHPMLLAREKGGNIVT